MRIKELRLKSGLTQKQLAKKMEIAQNTLSYWENGKYEPDSYSLKKLSDIFSVSVDYLLERTDYPKELPNVVEIGDFVNVELVANIRAGNDCTAIADISDIIAVPTRMLKGYSPDSCKAFIVKGNSMYPLYMDGDYIIVHLQTSVDSGDIAIVIYNGDEATVKKVRYVPGEDWVELIPVNPEYMVKRIEGDDVQNCFIYGKIISMLRL